MFLIENELISTKQKKSYTILKEKKNS